MKIFKHEGPGYYIGSLVVVVCETEEDAKELIRGYLDKTGLKDEVLNISEFEIKNFTIICTKNGDY
jgi:hypothetical protein